MVHTATSAASILRAHVPRSQRSGLRIARALHDNSSAKQPSGRKKEASPRTATNAAASGQTLQRGNDEASASFISPAPAAARPAGSPWGRATVGSLKNAQLYRISHDCDCSTLVCPLLLPSSTPDSGVPFALGLVLAPTGTDCAHGHPSDAVAATELHYVLGGVSTVTSGGGASTQHRAALSLAPGSAATFLPGQFRRISPRRHPALPEDADVDPTEWAYVALVALLPSPEAVAAGSGGEALRADVRRIAHAARAWTEARAGSGPEGDPVRVLTPGEVGEVLRASSLLSEGVDAVVVPEGGCGAPDAASPGRSGLHCTPIFRMPGQTNRVVLLYDPLSGSGGDSAAAAGAGAGAAGAAGGSGDGVRADFTFSLEIFEAGHVTSLHSHPTGYETFFLLSGSGVAHCDGVTFPVSAGDVVVFPPRTQHGIDIDNSGRVYCLQMMLPDDNFAAHVRSGEQKAALEAEDLCTLLRVGCMDSPPGLITVKNNATAAEADAGCSSEHASPRFPGRLRGAAGGANGASTSHSSSRN